MELIEVKHILQPGLVQRVSLVEPEDTITSFLERTEWKFKCPTICVVDATPVLRKDWATTTISSSRSVSFISRPHGGGGGGKARQVAGLVALIAIMAIAPWAAGPAGLALSGFAYYATVAAISIAGGLLISTFLKPDAASTNDTPISQLYSLTASGNVAAPLEPIPVQYGRLKAEPKYAGAPWHEYIGDDLFLNVPLCLGVGLFDHEQILIDDTVMWDHITGLQPGFVDITWQWVEPGDHLTLFPSNVVESGEVSNQSVTDIPSPYFTVNAPDTLATKITFDIVFPGGLYTLSPEGQYGNASVQLFGFIQEIDNAGSPIGSPVAVVNTLITMCNRQPKRISLECPGLDPGRYSARLYRQNPESTSQTVQDAIVWSSLRGFLQGGDTFPDVSVLALRMKATAQLSQNSAKRISVIQTRKTPVWNGSGFTTQASQNAFYAFLDAATNEIYGAGRSLSKIDLNTIIAQATAADARGDTFNYIFSSPQVTFQTAFDLILGSARSRVSWVGDILSVVRDEWKPIPQMLLTDQQIVRGSLSVDYIFNEEDSSDCVVGQFLNEDTWRPAQLQYPPNGGGFIGLKPATIRIEGITKPSHLYEEIGFMYRQSQLRRIRLRLDTEHDGRLLRFGSAVKIQSYLPNKWGTSGEVLTYNAGTHILTVSQEMPIEVGQHYIELRDKGGHYFGPVKCSLVFGHPNQILVDATDLALVESNLSTTISAALDRMDGAEPPAFAFGLASNLSRSCIVITGKPSEDRVTLELTVDSAAVHVTNEGDTPPQPTSPTLKDPRVPIIFGLDATFQQGIAEPYLIASWWPSVGAQFYRVQVSYDEGNSWNPYPDSPEPRFEGVVSLAALRIRVAAINASFHGPWSSKDVDAPTITIAADTVNPASLKQGLKDYVTKQLAAGTEEANKARQLIASVAAEHDAARALEFITANANRKTLHDFLQTDYNTKIETLSSEVVAGDSANLAEIIITQQTVVDNEAAQATLNTSVNASITSLTSGLVTANANITTNATAIATTSGALATLSTSVTAQFATANASIVANASAIVLTDASVASLTTSTTANFQKVQIGASAAITFTIASPGIVNWTAHGLIIGQSVAFSSTGTLPSPIVAGTTYYVTSSNYAANTFSVAATFGGTSINFSGTPSGTHAAYTINIANLSGSVTTNSIAIATANSAFSSYQTTVNAHLGTLDSSVTTNATAITTVSGAVAAIYTLTLDVNHFVSGYESTNTGSFATFTVIANVFQVVQPGVGGGTAVPVFSIQAVNGSAKLALRGDMVADGTITTDALNALSVTTAKLAAGAVVATTIAAGAVNTTQLAVNSVDINILISGAATKGYIDVWATQGTGVTGTFYLLGTGAPTVNNPVTHSILGGNADVTMNFLNLNFPAATNVNLIVDGTTVQTWNLTGNFAASLKWIVTGLSAGNHTFQISFVTGATPVTWYNGQFYVVDLRR